MDLPVSLDKNRAAVPAVSATGFPFGFILLPGVRKTSVAPVARFHCNHCFIDKHNATSSHTGAYEESFDEVPEVAPEEPDDSFEDFEPEEESPDVVLSDFCFDSAGVFFSDCAAFL
jgi:hypothetical protein